MDNIDDMLKSIDDALGNKNPDQPKDLKQTLLDQIDSAIGVKPEAKKEEVVTSTQPTAQPIAPPISQPAALPSPVPQATPVAEKKSTTAYPSAVPSPVPQPTPSKEKELDLSKPSNQIFSIVGNKKEEEFNPTDFELLNTLTTGRDLYEFKKLRPDISLNSLQQEKIFEYLRETTPWKIPEKAEDWFNLGKASLELIGKDLPVMVTDITGSFLKGGAKAIKQGVPFVLGQTSDYAEALEAEKLLPPEKRQEVEQWRQNAWRIANTPLKGGEKPNPNSYTDALYLEKVRAGLAPEQVAALNQKYEQKRAEAKQVPFEVTSELASLPESLEFMGAKVSEGGIQLWDTISEQAGLIDKEKAFERFMAREAVDTAKAKMQTNEPRAYARVVDTYFKPAATAIQSSYIPGFSAYTSLFHPSIEEYMITYPELTREEAKAKRQNEIENNVLNYLEDVKKTIPETDPDLQMLGSLAMPGQFGLDTFGYAVNVVEAAKALTPLAKSRFRKMLYTDDQINAIEAMAQRALKERELKKLEKKQTPGIIEKTAGSTAKGIEATGEFIEKSPTFQKISNIAPYVTGAALGYQFDPENPLRGMVAGGLGGAAIKFGLEKGAKALKETPKVIKEIQAARRISAGGEMGPLATLESIAKQQDEVKKLTAELKNLSEGTQEYIDTKKLLDEAKEKAKGIKAGGTEVVDYEGIGKVSDTTKNILKFVSDDIVSNVGEYAKLLVEPTLLGLATGIIDSSDEEELKAMIGQGLVFSIGGRALQQGYHQFIGEDPVVAARKARQVDVDALKTYRDSTPETREEINKLTDWNNVLERQSNKIDEATFELQGLQNDRAAMVEKNKNDLNFWNTDEFKNIDEKIRKLEKAVTSEQKSLSLLKTANVQTRNEFGRNFLHQLARNNMRLNGSLRSGQNNVGFNILSTQQIFDHFRNNPAYRDFSDADIMTAASQQGFYSGIGGSEFNPGASVTDSTKGLIFDPNKPSIVINSDSLRNRMMLFGETPTEALNHETGHHILKIKEIQDAVADARNILFTNEIRDASGNVKEISNGLYTSDDLNKMFSKNYLKNRSKEEIAQISQSIGLWDYNTNSLNPELVKNYMQEEILADMFANTLSRNVAKDLNDKRTHLFDVANLKMKNGLLKSAVTKMLGYGLSSDVVSEATNANISPEAQSAARNAMRLLESMNGDFTSIASLPQTTPISKAEIKKSKIAAERYGMDSGLFETKTVAQVFDENGKPIGTPIDVTDPAAFEGSWRIKSDGEERLSGYGQIPVSLRQLQVPNGGTLSISKRIVTEADGETPKLLKPEKLEKLQKDRASLFKQAIDTPDYGTPGRFEAVSEGSETYRGSFTPMQVKAIQDLPEGIVPLKIKKYLLDLNEAIVKKDGTRFYMDYAAVMDDKGNYKAFSPKIYDVVPIGLQLSTKGNFLVTTISVGRLMEKLNLWGDRMPNRLDPWSGSKTAFWNDFSTKYLDNWTKGIEGSGYNKQGEAIGNTLDSDVQKAEIKKSILNDFLNLATNDTRDFNLDRTTIPRRKGDPKNKSLDRTIGSMRIDHIAELLNAEYLTKLPIDYGKAKINFMPERMEGEVPTQEKRQIDENVKFANPPSEKSAIDALSSNKREYFGMHRGLDDGYPVGIRIDIPAFTSKGVYVVTVHEKKKGGERGQVGERIGYDTIAKVDNPIFFSNEVGAKKIKSGEANKFPVATVEGQFNSSREIPEDINEWTPVGYNPREHSYFYDKTNDEPVLSGDEAISVGNTVFVKNPVYGDKANFAFMPERPIEERYPTSERGMYSGLQKTIDEKVQGKFASPDQLKAIVTNPQNVKAEELKWSGVLGEIDRLAQENNGKVPKDKVMDYLRNEGSVKFEEVTLGGTTKTWTQDEIDTLEREARRTRNWDAYEQAVLEFEDQQLGSDANSTGNQTKYAQYQLPGGTNYREVVMTMPNKIVEEEANLKKQIFELNKQQSEFEQQSPEWNEIQKQLRGLIDRQSDLVRMPSSERAGYTSSHFPDIPNYVAHARVNDRVDAKGRKGRFIEEFQSDRHQDAREYGYKEDSKVLKEQRADGTWHVELPDGTPKNFYTESDANQYIASNNTGVPDAPFRKDWYIQIFKRQLRDAVDAGEEWIGWTTGIEQVNRYENAMRKAVDEITWNTPKGYQKAFAAIKNGNTVLTGKINEDGTVYDSNVADANDKQLSEVVGKEIAAKITSENSGTATGDDLTVGGEGMKGFYDTILPKEIGKYVAKMGGKVEKSEIDQSEAQYKVNRDSQPLPYRLEFSDSPEVLARFATANEAWAEAEKRSQTPIWEVNITPEMAGKVRAGQLQFMPEQLTEYEPISARIRPLEGISAPTKMVGAKAPVLGEIEPPVRGKAMLPDIELKPDISEKGIQSSDITSLQFMPEDQRAAEQSGKPLRGGLSAEESFGRPSEEYVERDVKRTYWNINSEGGSLSLYKETPWDEDSDSATGESKYSVFYSENLESDSQDEYKFSNPADAKEKIDSILRDETEAAEYGKWVESTIDSFRGTFDFKKSKYFTSAEVKPIGWSSKSSSRYFSVNLDIKPEIAETFDSKNIGYYEDGTLNLRVRFADHAEKSGPSNDISIETRDYHSQQFGRQDSKTAESQMASAIADGVLWKKIAEIYNDPDLDFNRPAPSTSASNYSIGINMREAPLTGLQFMPASPVTKTQTGYDYTYLDEALKNGKNGKVALTRPVRADEALPLLSQRIPITNQVDRNSFDYLSPAEVEFYQYENNPVSFKFDPALLKKPVFKDAAVEHAGKNVQLAMADRQTASGGDMGGIMFPWLKSNIDSTVIGDDGIEYRAVWGNQEWKPVLSMKNKNKKFNSYNLLTYLMGPDAHASNTRQVRVISNEIENSNISRKQKDLFLMLANIGVKNQKRADQRDNINEANKDIDKTNKLIEESSDPQEIKKLNKVIKQKENDIVLANIKYNQFLENPNEELIKSVITKYKTAYTRFKNKTGSESNFIKNKKTLDDFKKTASFKDLLKTIKNKQLISLDDTFKGRKASIAQILGLTIDDFNVDNILDQTMDFKNGRINHIVGSIELSRNPDLMAVYLGDDPDQAKRMTAQESKAAAQLKANPNFVPHEAYAWAMLGPVNGNHFLNSNPKTHLEYFPDFKEAYASIQESEDKKQKIREGNETTLMGAMRDNTQMALAMPAISDKK